MVIDYYNKTLQIGDTGTFNEKSIGNIIGNKNVLLQKHTHNSFTSGKIHSLIIYIKNAVCKFDFDILLFNTPITSSVENNKPLKLSHEDSLNIFSKIRVESADNDTDDFLQPIGGHFIGTLYNLNIPFRGTEINLICIYQEYSKKICNLDNNLFLNFAYEVGQVG